MRLLIMFLLLSCLLLTIVSNAWIPVEQASSSEWIRFLHLDDCELPCWINIVPGITTLAEAQAQIEAVYAAPSLYDVTKSDYYYGVIYRSTGHQVRIWFRSDDGEFTGNALVRVIHLELGVLTEAGIERPTLAELRTFLGDPEMVRLASSIETPTVVLIYRNGRIHTSVEELECDRVLLNQEAPAIALYEEAQTHGAWLSDPQQWIRYNYCYNFERALS